jgi:hypothetical protein
MAFRKQERRIHRRWELTCPVTVLNDAGKVLFKTRAVNISDGGAYCTVGVDDLPANSLPPKLGIRFSVPRSTRNSFMFEEFQSEARVIRTEPLVDAAQAGMAIQFLQPVSLDLNA